MSNLFSGITNLFQPGHASHGQQPPQPATEASSQCMETFTVNGESYVATRILGEGAFSVVYLCYRQTGGRIADDRTFALKRMNVTDELRPHVEEEIRVLTLDEVRGSPFIVRCHAAEVTGGKHLSVHTALIVMEHCDTPLVALMKEMSETNRRFPETAVLKIFSSVAAAIATLHALAPPSAHRDIKPENVLLSVPGGASGKSRPHRAAEWLERMDRVQFKLCDFGSVTSVAYQCFTRGDVLKAEDEIQRYTTLCYRSPEAVDPWRRQRIDQQVDVWALGVFLYYICYFKLPFEETNLAILNGRYDIPSDSPIQYSELVVGLISNCLTADPKERWSVFDLLGCVAAATEQLPSGFVIPEPSPVPQPLGTSEAPPPTPGGGGGGGGGGGAGLMSMLEWSAAPQSGSPPPQQPPRPVQQPAQRPPQQQSPVPAAAPKTQRQSLSLFDDPPPLTTSAATSSSPPAQHYAHAPAPPPQPTTAAAGGGGLFDLLGQPPQSTTASPPPQPSPSAPHQATAGGGDLFDFLMTQPAQPPAMAGASRSPPPQAAVASPHAHQPPAPPPQPPGPANDSLFDFSEPLVAKPLPKAPAPKKNDLFADIMQSYGQSKPK